MISLCIAFGAKKASFFIHRYLLQSALHCPMSFFDTTPLGRILNRFSRDMDMVDQRIPLFVQVFISNVTQLVSIVFLIIYTIPLSAVVVVFLAVVFIIFQVRSNSASFIPITIIANDVSS